MARFNKNKLNLLFTGAPSGVVLPTSWLRDRGISSKLAWWYVHSGWLERVGANAYCRRGDTITWVGVVYCLEQLIRLPVHIGAKTALILLGRAHNIPLGGLKRVILFGSSAVKIPNWVNNSKHWDQEFSIIKTKLFGEDKSGVTEKRVENLNVQISSPELAILEVMHLVPNHETYKEALLLMENLTNLRPKVIQELLERCQSIKVKRLFLHCAEKLNHDWLNEIDISRIDLGSGKRKIGEGGDYDAKYMLSVPKINET